MNVDLLEENWILISPWEWNSDSESLRATVMTKNKSGGEFSYELNTLPTDTPKEMADEIAWAIGMAREFNENSKQT